MRDRDAALAVTAKVAVAEVIHDEDHDIGTVRATCGDARCHEKEE